MPATDIPATNEILLKTDASKQFLDALLGQGWETFGQSLGGSQAAELMLQIFAAFNLVALALLSAFFIWIMAIAVAGTAHEGVPFGKKFSSLWMPLRCVMAMGALAPIFKGLSIFQIALLACIGWSINLGNYVCELGVDYFVEHGGQITVQAPDQNVTKYSSIANGTLTSLTRQYYLRDRRGLNVQPGGQWQYSENLITRGGESTFFFNGNAGKITIDCINPSDALCAGKRNAVEPAIASLHEVAAKLADPNVPASDIDPTALYNAANIINANILSGLQSYAKQGQLQAKLKDFQDLAGQYGWFITGSSYWSISWINQETRAAMYSGITYSAPEWTESEWDGMTHGLHDAGAVEQRLKNYIATAYANRRGITDTTASPSVTDEENVAEMAINWIKSVINSTVGGNITQLTLEYLGQYDPIMALSNIGDYFIGIAEGLFFALFISSKIPFLSSDGITVFLAFSVVLPLALYGIVLAYYLPAIPFIRWVSALCGWIILIVESLIAAPLWICAHALPEGDGAAGQHGRRGYMLFLGILIRPPLMVAGFFCAVVLLNVLGRLVGTGFELIFSGMSQAKVMGLVGPVSMSIILGAVIIMAANKFFSLIHYLPEHVTNWIGQQLHSLGEKEDQAGTKTVIAGSTNAISESSREAHQRVKARGRGGNVGNEGGQGNAGGAGSGSRGTESIDSSIPAGTPTATENNLQG